MTKYICSLVSAGMLVLLATVVAETVRGESPSVEEAAVISAENDWVRAEINKDEDTLRRVIHAEFVLNSNHGQTSGREALIAGVLESNMTDQTITERSVIVNGDTAVIFGTADMRFMTAENQEFASLLRYTTTYVKRDGQWQAIALHMVSHAASQ